jgi:hypothetical protein
MLAPERTAEARRPAAPEAPARLPEAERRAAFGRSIAARIAKATRYELPTFRPCGLG